MSYSKKLNRFNLKSISLSRQVLLITIIVLTWIILYKTWFLKINAIFPNAYEIGEIVYGLGSSVIASAIFYYIVVYRPTKQKHDTLRQVVDQRMLKFKLSYILIKKDIYSIKNLEVPDDLPEDHNEFIKVCEGILLTDKPPFIFNNPIYYPTDWYDYFEYYFGLDSHNTQRLSSYWEEIPIEVKVLLEDLQTNTLHSGLRTYKSTGFSNKLSDLGGPLWNHLNILKAIPETLERTMKI